MSKSSSSVRINSYSSSFASILMGFPFSYKMSFFLCGFLREMHTDIIAYLSFFSLCVLGDLGTSTTTPALFGEASTTSISCAASLGADIILLKRSYVSFDNLSNVELSLKASKFARSIQT